MYHQQYSSVYSNHDFQGFGQQHFAPFPASYLPPSPFSPYCASTPGDLYRSAPSFTGPSPPQTYACHKCGAQGQHWVTDCPRDQAQMVGRYGEYASGPAGRGSGSFKRSRDAMSKSQPGDGRGTRVVMINGHAQTALRGSEDLYCEVCEKDFSLECQYKAHLASHEQCKFPGCAYSASRQVLVGHYRVMHGKYKGNGFRTIEVEGRLFRILVGNVPQEVEQWRADRRKNYPTQATVGRKLAERAKYLEGRRGFGRGHVSKRELVAMRGQAKKGKFVGLVAAYDSDDGEEGKDQQSGRDPVAQGESEKQFQQHQQECIRSALYGVCRAFLRGICQEGKTCRFRHGPRRGSGPQYCRYYMRIGGTCQHADTCQYVHDAEVKQAYEAWVQDRRRRAREARDADDALSTRDKQGMSDEQRRILRPSKQQKPQTMRKPEMTLLKKLLGKEVERESKLLLACIRFLVDTQFLQVASNEPSVIRKPTLPPVPEVSSEEDELSDSKAEA